MFKKEEKNNEIKLTREEFRKIATDVVAKEGNDTDGIPSDDKAQFSFAKTMMGMMFVMEIEKALFGENVEGD